MNHTNAAQGFAVLLPGAGVPPMVRRICFRAFLPVESTILDVAGIVPTGTLPDRSSDGAGWISDVEAESTLAPSRVLDTGTGVTTAGFRAAGTGPRLPDEAALRGSGMIWSAGRTPATVRGLSSVMASIGASINRLGVRIRSARSEPGREAADITSWAQAASTAPPSARCSERPDFRRLRAPFVRAGLAGSTTRAGSARGGSGLRAG